MAEDYLQNVSASVEDFRRARRRAALEQITSRLKGQSTELFSYQEVLRKLRGKTVRGRTLEQIPLDAIVGSVGRYMDFTRTFLPRSGGTMQRWAHIKSAMTGLSGVPPIDVYRIGEVFFVQDGNHRVSVAREMGLATIEAYVTKVATKVPFAGTESPDDLIIKAEYTEFLDETGIDHLVSGAELRVTVPGQYVVLLEHIAVHRYFMGIEQQRDVPYDRAVVDWYRQVYEPVIGLIQERGLMRGFPDRTETDLYLWIAEHRANLEEALGWDLATDTAAMDLAARFSPKTTVLDKRRARRERVLQLSSKETASSGLPAPDPTRFSTQREFEDILVSVRGPESGWRTLEQAMVIARQEHSGLDGLHVIEPNEDAYSDHVHALREEFVQRAATGGIHARLAVEAGGLVNKICERARFTDLIIAGVGDRTTLFDALLRRCPRPVLAVPSVRPEIRRLLLAFDGSRKSEEALYLAAYMANRWHASVTVVTGQSAGSNADAVIKRAAAYLDAHWIEAAYRVERCAPHELVLETARERGIDLILVGRHSRRSALEAMLGSTCKHILRAAPCPVLICT